MQREADLLPTKRKMLDIKYNFCINYIYLETPKQLAEDVFVCR